MPMPYRAATAWAAGLLLIALLLLSDLANGRAQDEADRAEHVLSSFDEAVAQIARDVADALEVLNRTDLQVGPIAGPPHANCGAGLLEAIRGRLPHWVKVSSAADAVRLSGTYASAQDPASGRVSVAIGLSLRNAAGEELHELPRYLLTDEPTLLTLLAGNGSLPLAGGANRSLSEARHEALMNILAKPSFALQRRGANWRTATVLRPSADSPYGLEILDLVRTDRNGTEYFWPLNVFQRDELPTVEIDRDRVFAVRLINDSLRPVAVALSVNGASSLAIGPRPGDPPATPLLLGQWIVGPMSPSAIVWEPRRAGRWTEFRAPRVGPSNQSAESADALGGVITAVFSAAYTDKRPADEPPPEAVANGEQWLREGRKVEDRDRPIATNFGLSRGAVSLHYRVKAKR